MGTPLREFLARLRMTGGLVVTERRGHTGGLSGYAGGLADDLDRRGRVRLYGRRKLAADLSLPKLEALWASLSEPTPPGVRPGC